MDGLWISGFETTFLWGWICSFSGLGSSINGRKEGRVGIFFHCLPAVSSGLHGHWDSIPDDRLGIPPDTLQRENTSSCPIATHSHF